MGLIKDSKGWNVRVINLVLTFAVNIALCVAVPAEGAQGTIRVFNVIGDVVTMSNCRDFIGRSLPAGSITIEPMKEIEWRFQGYPTVNRNWTCHFQWIDSADCSMVPGGPCRVHSKEVSLWSSVCVDCVWRTHQEGFYRRDGRVQPANWQFMFGWN
ncbi:hypothetical protein M758_6G205800 [Ceratodon purpureus]|nr:hypothetical protein M758_6G205800 [Ceratodon purpureus]